MSNILYTYPENFLANKALLAAAFSGTEVVVDQSFKYGVTNKTHEFIEKFPLAKVPALETTTGKRLFESNAIAFHLANEDLRGKNPEEQAEILQWMAFADNELLPRIATLVFDALKIVERPQQELDEANNSLIECLNFVNTNLEKVNYIVSNRITLADLALFGLLIPLYQHVKTAKTLSLYKHKCRWFLCFAKKPQVIKALGEIVLKQEKEASAPAPAPAAAPAGDEIPAEPKKKDPFAKFEPGTFVMDAFKREYSNKSEEESIAWFWQNFDKEHYSIWFCEYLYPEELKMVFMSCNLIGGMMQRLDTMRKHAFGSMCLFGEDYKSTISGIWIWRGHELAFDLSPDWQVDYESYKWTKLDPDNAEHRKTIDEYLRWEGDFGGKQFNQGKIFK